MYYDLTKGRIGKCLILFALPMIAGNLLQQFYNIADTLIVGRVLGKNALAAVGSAYTLMTFLTSVFLGLSMGSGALFSIYKGKGSDRELPAFCCPCFWTDHECDGDVKCGGVPFYGPDPLVPAGAGRSVRWDENISACDLCRACGNIPL